MCGEKIVEKLYVWQIIGKMKVLLKLVMYIPQKNKEIKDIVDYTKALVTTLIDFQNNVHLHSDDWQRTIYIDTLGISSIDFNISDSKKQKLVNSGITHTEAYLEWYNSDEKKANK